MINIIVIIIIYNKFLTESTSLISILDNKNKLKVIVIDNSTTEQYIDFNLNVSKRMDILYYQFKSNIGLSKAYNFAIRQVQKNDKTYLLLLDDDSILNDNYINNLYSHIESNKNIDIFMPIVYSNKNIISPSNTLFNCKVQQLKSLNTLNIRKVTAINSGLLIKSSVFLNYTYDEKIFLDYVDHYFFREMRKLNKSFFVMEDNIIYQNFSRDNLSSFKNTFTRFKIYIKDFKYYTKYSFISKLYYYINTLKLAISYTLSYKKIDFILEIVRCTK